MRCVVDQARPTTTVGRATCGTATLSSGRPAHHVAQAQAQASHGQDLLAAPMLDEMLWVGALGWLALGDQDALALPGLALPIRIRKVGGAVWQRPPIPSNTL